MGKRKTLYLPKQMSTEQRAYEASSSGRRLGAWDAPALSPRKASTTELDLIRKRSRAGIRNNPWLSRAIKVIVANEVGTGIIPRPNTPDKKLNAELLELWRDFAPTADANGMLTVYAIQAQAVRACRESGEAFIRIIRTRPSRSQPVPLQFQLLEADYCPLSLNVQRSDANDIVNGVEVNSAGKAVAYWLYKSHPDDGYSFSMNDLERVPVENMIHHFIPDRPGQLRGVPAGTQSMVRAYVFDKYDDAELGRKEARANFTGVIRRPDYGSQDYKFDPISGEPITKDGSDVPMIDMETGTFPSLLPGEDITLFDGDDAGRGYSEYQRWQLLALSAGYDTPYQLISGDYNNINDRVWRAIMNQFHLEIEQNQDLFTIPQLCRRMWIEFVDRAILSGAIDAPSDFAVKRLQYIRAEHRAPAFKHIHPVQDVQAKVLEVENAFKSRQRVVDELRGEPVEEVDRQRKEDADREKKHGLNQQVIGQESSDDKPEDKQQDKKQGK